MPGTRRALYSSALEDCKVSWDSSYLEESCPETTGEAAVDQRMRAEAYLFFSILSLRERVPVISAGNVQFLAHFDSGIASR